jgi:hypothetical protein
MEILQGYAYHIKDSYFELAQDKNLMQNKEDGNYRPTLYCVKNGNPVPVKKELQRVIRKNVKSLLALNNKGIKVTFTDINKLQRLFIKF